MPFVALPYALHVLAAVIWVGGMFFAWMVLRPAAGGALQPAERLRLWSEVLRRFFAWVWAAVLVLALSGIVLWHLHFGAMAPRYVHLMAGAFLAMLAIFLRLQLLLLPALNRAVESQAWADGGQVLARIRRLVGINLLLGLATVVIASTRLSF
ncbi:CopD family protein [Stutzerimonas balearica]|uniref:CopD family protein n=1 Tax=Stutzerimonas balearica TaxID=74829 RepID=UPI0028A1F580|nr:CopD family protein [Stutzerimonas balearica]